MATNRKQDHVATLQMVAPSGGVTTGTPYLIDSTFGVALETAAEGDLFTLATQGVFDLTKQSALSIAAGVDCYWDDGASEVDTTNTNEYIGKCVVAAGASDATVQVALGLSVTSRDDLGDATNVTVSLFDANTILKADTDDSPEALPVAEDTLVGRTAGNDIDALTAAEARTLLNVEDDADATDWTNVAAALSTATGDVDVNGQAITNVGNVDGRDVGTDGSTLDTTVSQVTALGAENTDGHMCIPFTGGVAEAGTWTASIAGDGLPIVTRSADAADEEYWIEVPAPARTFASKGIKPTGMKAVYSVDTAAADDVRFELWKRTLNGDGASPSAAVLFGDADGDYDGDHDTAVKRGDNTGDPKEHTATITDAGTPAYLGDNEQLIVRVFVGAAGAATSEVAIEGLELLYSETRVDLS